MFVFCATIAPVISWVKKSKKLVDKCWWCSVWESWFETWIGAKIWNPAKSSLHLWKLAQWRFTAAICAAHCNLAGTSVQLDHNLCSGGKFDQDVDNYSCKRRTILSSLAFLPGCAWWQLGRCPFAPSPWCWSEQKGNIMIIISIVYIIMKVMIIHHHHQHHHHHNHHHHRPSSKCSGRGQLDSTSRGCSQWSSSNRRVSHQKKGE